MEYASLLGRHDIISMMLVGGIDPTICNDVNDDDDDDDGDGDIGKSEDYNRSDTMDVQYSSKKESASRAVLSLLHSIGDGRDSGDEDENEDNDDDCIGASRAIPLSMWTYVVRAVIEMRMNGALFERDNRAETDDDSSYLHRRLCIAAVRRAAYRLIPPTADTAEYPCSCLDLRAMTHFASRAFGIIW